MKVLCIDDSATMRKIISMAIKSAGHEVTEAENGKAGLELLTTLKPDCVLLDMNMPEMSGFDFLRAKSEAVGPAVPVIMITTEADEGARARAKELGAAGFLAKPFQKEALIEAVARATAGA